MKEPVLILERWFRKNHRTLPWRKTRDPYAIWLSEVMLQQTQVATVLPYYERFLAKFPTIESLAKAPEQSVLSLWSGLGYYSRARNLKRGAQFILDHHLGFFPTTREEALKIPGIGPYTAGAVLSIAFDLPEPIVDGNVYRVFSRYFNFAKNIDLPKNQDFFWEKAQEWVTLSRSPRELNQALMELGALICTKAAPSCDTCPLAASCLGFKKGTATQLPVRKKRREPVPLHWNLLVFKDGDKIFLKQNEKGAWWAGLWDLPQMERVKGLPLCQVKHTVTHHRIEASAFLASGKPPRNLKGRWLSIQKLNNAPLSSLCRKVLAHLPT